MRTSRRNILIRTVAVLAGDIAVGVALATACSWLIQVASLGLFLSFLAWLLALVAALAVSQHVLHPAVGLLLSDRKLDVAVLGAQRLVSRAQHWAAALWPA